MSMESSTHCCEDAEGRERTIAELEDRIRVIENELLLKHGRAEDSQQLMRYMVDQAQDDASLAGPDGRFYYVNDAKCRSLGYTCDELLSMHVWDVDMGITRDKWAAAWQYVKRHGFKKFETWHRTKHGQVFWTEVSVTYFDFHGREYVCAFVRDVTERKRAEEELRRHRDELEMRVTERTSELKRSNEDLNEQLRERTRAENALRVSEERLHRISRAGRIGLFEWNVDRDTAYYSSEAYELYGLRPGFTGTYKKWLEIVHSDDRETVERTITEAREKARNMTSISAQVEFRVLHPDGTVLWLLVTATSSIECGDLIARGVVRDITKRKQAEEALRESEAKYRELVENANSIILKLDTCGSITFFNEFAQLYFGYRLNEILGKNVIGTIVPVTESSGRDLSKLIGDICAHPQLYTINENENMLSNGERVWVSWTNKAITDDHGKVIGVLCVGNDITALMKAETELKRARDELELRVRDRTAELENANKFLLDEIEARKQAEKETVESEEKFRTLVETSPVPIILHREVSIIYANPAAAEAAGCSAEEIKKMKFWEPVLPQYKELIKERELARLRGEDPPSICELEVQTNKGVKWAKIVSTRVMYEGNQAILAIMEDITPYKEAELYVDLMGHDISNINQAGMGNLELLQSTGKLDAQEQEQLSTALQAFEKSSGLIKNVKKLQKVKKGDLYLEKIDIGQILDKVKNDYQTVPGRDITIRLESPEGCFVHADGLLYDVFSNIVDNSIKHSSGPIDVNINLSSIEIDGKKHCRVSIEDDGPGIKPDIKKRIFNRMYYEGGIMRGKGLGLYLVHTLVEYFHGTIYVEDRIPGDHTKGSRFVVTLPRCE